MDDNRARGQAEAQFDSIKKLMTAYSEADEKTRLVDVDGDLLDYDEILERIQETPLSVQVRTGWYTPGADAIAEEYEILLCTGGPAVRITGDMDRYGMPHTARLEYQDWGTPWEWYMEADEKVLLAFAQHFLAGE